MDDVTRPDYSLFRHFSRLTIVNVISNITEPLAGLISVAFLGHLTDINYLAGVSLSSVIFNYIYENLIFLRISTTAITAQATGRKDRDAVLMAALRGGLVALFLGILVFLLQYPIGALGFSLLKGSPIIESIGWDYFSARIWGVPAGLLNYVIVGWLIGQEQSNKALFLGVIGNSANIVLNYLTIVQWHMGGMGAGLSQAMSEYLMVGIGLFFFLRSLKESPMGPAAISQVWHWPALRTTLSFNRDLFLKSAIYTSVWTAFFSLSAQLGAEVLAENTLLQQIIFLHTFLVEGIGFTTETLTGNFEGQKATNQFSPLLKLSWGTSFLVGALVSGFCIAFPDLIFGLLTNHTEILESIKPYNPWLLIVLCAFSTAWILEGYFAGLLKGKLLLNTALVTTLFGFVPMAICTGLAHSNHLLWLSFSMFMVIRVILLSLQLPQKSEDYCLDN